MQKNMRGKDKFDSGFYTTIIVARQKRHVGFGEIFRHKKSRAWEGVKIDQGLVFVISLKNFINFINFLLKNKKIQHKDLFLIKI
jgi:hypothetical protein